MNDLTQMKKTCTACKEEKSYLLDFNCGKRLICSSCNSKKLKEYRKKLYGYSSLYKRIVINSFGRVDESGK